MRAAIDAAGREVAQGKGGLAIASALTDAVEATIRRSPGLPLRGGRARRLVGRGRAGDRQLRAPGARAVFRPRPALSSARDSPDAKIEALAHAILVPLWDAKVDAGQAVRSVADGLGLPDTDLAAATALLDARFMLGDQGLAKDFLARYEARVARTTPDSLVARLREEQEGRHSRFGDTIFMLEPDLKNGPGGIRDLCVGRWAAQARFRVSTPEALRDLGEMSARQAEAWSSAIDFMLRARAALHLAAGRRQDQLRFDLQERIAPILHPEFATQASEDGPVVTPAVEALMRDFQTHARTIQHATERLMQRVCARPAKRSATRPVRLPGSRAEDPSFVRREGKLEVKDSLIFEKHPSEMIRLFFVAQELDVGVGPATMDLVGERAASHGEALRADPDSAARFLDVLCNVRDAATPSRLEQMHNLGLVSALLPEWVPVSGRVQHDIYHVYTVDQHSLYAVATLKAIARGDLRADYPEVCERLPRRGFGPGALPGRPPARRGQAPGRKPRRQGSRHRRRHRHPARAFGRTSGPWSSFWCASTWRWGTTRSAAICRIRAYSTSSRACAAPRTGCGSSSS